MTEPQRPRRRRQRWHEHDYQLPGCYFVTICIQNMERVLGSIRDGRMALSTAGRLVDRSWKALGEDERVHVDESIVMPNHLHGILWLRAIDGLPPLSLSSVVGRFKSLSTRALNQRFASPGRVWWQRGFHDRVVRDERELTAGREYIRENPAR